MELLIGGDFCITPDFLEKNLFDPSVVELFNQSDYNIVNLECPITQDNANNKILKTGPHLCTDERICCHLKKININAVTLANNHLLDYGEKGLCDTLNTLQSQNISFVGGGKNIAEASKPLFIENNNLRIAVINFCENEWSIATNDCGGANPLDIVDNTNQIKEAKQKADFVIVIAHGGHEYYQLPSPRMVKQYRFFIDNGADAVIGHHTHCISGFEIYNNCPIAYSLGNMIFTIESKFPEWYFGLLAKLSIKIGESVKIDFVPVQQISDDFTVNVLTEKENVFNIINKLNIIINHPDTLQAEWENFINNRVSVIDVLSPINAIPGKYIRNILKRFGANKYLLKPFLLKSYLNNIRCEAHRDVLIKTISKKIK